VVTLTLPDGVTVVIATLEIKTKISEALALLAKQVRERWGFYFLCSCGDDAWFDAVPTRIYRCQVLHQALVLRSDYAAFVMAEVTGLIYTCVVHVPEVVRQDYLASLLPFSHLVAWAYRDEVRGVQTAFAAVREGCPSMVCSNTRKLFVPQSSPAVDDSGGANATRVHSPRGC
jgi:hypothetical protein